MQVNLTINEQRFLLALISKRVPIENIETFKKLQPLVAILRETNQIDVDETSTDTLRQVILQLFRGLTFEQAEILEHIHSKMEAK